MPFAAKQVLLGHKNGSVTTHYSMPRILELLEAAERVVNVADSASVVRVIAGNASESPAKGPHQNTKTTAKVA